MSGRRPRVGDGRTPPVRVADPLAFLLGTWALERRLVDLRLGLEGRFEGLARVEPGDRAPATYREEGLVTWPGHVGPAFRSLQVVPAGTGALELRFPDGRFFHRLELVASGYEAEHPCGRDRYLGRFVLLGPDAWSATWVVEGPAKSQRLEATYTRRSPVSPVGPGTSEPPVSRT